MIEFTAAVVAAQELEGLDTFVVAFAERKDGGGLNFQIQLGLAESVGLNEYCITTESGETVYDAVKSWSLESGLLTIMLASMAKQVLGAEGYIVHFSPSKTAVVRAGLERILGASRAAQTRLKKPKISKTRAPRGQK